MKLLMHTCCAPCSVACVKALRAEGIEPTAYWYNPNIHPYAEYRTRRDTLHEYAARIGVALETEDDYGLRPFAEAVAGDIAGRCLTCCAARMRQTARRAKAGGYTHFTSTLLISPYQNHELLRAAAEQAAAEFGVAFLYRDFRPLFREGQAEARKLSLYMQRYCGCVYSEQERLDTRYHAKPPAGATLAAPRGIQAAPSGTAEDGARQEASRKLAWPRLREAGERFEAARAAEAAALLRPNRPAAKAAAKAAATPAPDPLVALLSVQTERVLWEARNVMRCAADSGLWEAVYCDMPVWRHVYHMLHSLDQWYMDPGTYAEPPIHLDGLNDLDRAMDAPAFSLLEMEAYLAGIAGKLRTYLAALPDAQLPIPPEGSPNARLALAVAALRHLTAHFGMIMGFVIAARGTWPLTIGMKGTLPTEDDGLPHYA